MGRRRTTKPDKKTRKWGMAAALITKPNTLFIALHSQAGLAIHTVLVPSVSRRGGRRAGGGRNTVVQWFRHSESKVQVDNYIGR